MNREHSLSYRLNTMLLIAAVAAATSGCVNKAQQNFERPPAPVTVAAAVSQDVSNYLDALGKIVARETVSIKPQVAGRITQIHFTDGANVEVPNPAQTGIVGVIVCVRSTYLARLSVCS